MERPIRVLVNAIHSRAGGGRTYLEEVLPRLAQRPGLQTTLVCTADQLSWLRPGGFDVRVLRGSRGSLQRHFQTQFLLPGIARQTRADVVFTPANYGPLLCGVRSQLLMRNTPAAVAATRRIGARLAWSFQEFLARRALRSARGAMVVSEAFRRYLVASWGVDPRDLRVVHHGVGEHFAPGLPGEEQSALAPYVLIVSTLRPQKNIETAIDALAIARKQIPHLQLVVIGGQPDRDYRERIVGRARRWGVADAVKLAGAVPSRELPPWYRGAEAVLCISLAETFGLSQVEAMACGVPVIASDLEYAREICGDAARYVPPRDAAAVAQAIREVIADRPRRERLIGLGLERARRFSWDRTAAEVAEALRERARLAARLRGAPSGSPGRQAR